MQNREIAAIFNELADLLEIKGENPFRVRAYRNAARVIEGLGKSVEEMIDDGEDLTKLPGIGEDLAEKIVEIVRTGKLQKLEEVKKEVPETLRVVEEESYGAALHYFTGSKSHNIAIRKMAVEMGLKVNEYGVFKEDERIAGKSEEEIYALFKLPYIEPELRENRGEIEAAQNGTLPRLITPDKIAGDLHMHTTCSDGLDTLETMTEAARKKGYAYIAVTDHSQTLAVVKGLDEKKFRQQMEAIDRLNEKWNDFTILKGMEVDILEDGTLGMDEALLKELDIVLGAVHSKFSLSRKEQTRRLIRAIENPLVNVIAHPTGRLIGKRAPIALDMDEIYKALVDRNVFMEINAQPTRLDLDDTHTKTAKEAGVRFTISTDAHAATQLNFMRYGIYQARRGWLEPDDVLNTRPLKTCLEMLRK